MEIVRQAARRAEEQKRQQEESRRQEMERRRQERLVREAKERAEQEAREKERRAREQERLEREAKERAEGEALAKERRAREEAKWAALTAAAQSDKSVTVNVTLLYRNSGGWVVDYEGSNGFMPQSHSGEYRNRDDGRVDDVAVVVLEVETPERSRRGGNFVVSRRLAVSITKKAAWQGFSAAAGDCFEGVVSGIANFGIFVRLESGVEGLAHISALGGPDSLAQYEVGQRVLVSVLSVDYERMRVALRVASA